ncbi:MAG: superoxide dismutase family protein [Bradyrhizobium sp.]|jgi:Cu-Zn family superoxide dismutase
MTPLIRLNLASAGILLAALAPALGAEPSLTAHAQIKNQNGDLVGTADLMETRGGLLIKLALQDLKPGQHAVHLHEVGRCDPPFTTAGAHFNPDHSKHGMLVGEGHAGDLPNLHIPDSGKLEVEFVTTKATLEKGKPNSLLDQDGSSVVIHAAADDYQSDPAGASGDRIACGVIGSPSTVGSGSPRK